ncbi:Cytochrome c-type protein NapC [compost metagenome]
MKEGQTCIDCHKGIAHQLPNMEGVDPGWRVPPELEGDAASASSIDALANRVQAAHQLTAEEPAPHD